MRSNRNVGGNVVEAGGTWSKADTVRRFTHTSEPVSGADGRRAYGCTEFVFNLESNVVRAGRADVIVQHVERWLEWTPEERLCAPGVNQLCIEP